MNIEVEKKFLVKNNDWKRETTKSIFLKQGYLCIDKGRTVRIRMSEERCYLNVKGESDENFRLEFEYDIPRKDALVLIHTICLQPVVSKTRHLVWKNEFCWEVDEFHEENEGLVMAEIELAYPEQKVNIPEWIGEEVTGDPRYYNASLVSNPYQNWK